MNHARIGILVVAYNAVSTLVGVLDRIPVSLRDSIEVVLVSDDHSTDPTYEVALEYQRMHDALPLAVVRQRRNLGYGGNQKFGYRWLAEHGCDIAVLLHGDGQYAPEILAELLGPLVDGRADVVLGLGCSPPEAHSVAGCRCTNTSATRS
jgi:glycosyltransferase involved in cell wall biosynthesis